MVPSLPLLSCESSVSVKKKTLTEKNNIETSQLIYRANQLTGFYMVVNLAYNELKAYLRPCQKSTMKCFAKTVASY